MMTLQFKNYTKNLSKPNEESKFLLPWGGILLRNCDDLGDLLSFKSVAQYRDQEKPLWLVLSLVLFRDNVWHFQLIFCVKHFFLQGELFQIYSCNCCSVMEIVSGMRLDQRKEELPGVFTQKLEILSSHLGMNTGL